MTEDTQIFDHRVGGEPPMMRHKPQRFYTYLPHNPTHMKRHLNLHLCQLSDSEGGRSIVRIGQTIHPYSLTHTIFNLIIAPTLMTTPHDLYSLFSHIITHFMIFFLTFYFIFTYRPLDDLLALVVENKFT